MEENCTGLGFSTAGKKEEEQDQIHEKDAVLLIRGKGDDNGSGIKGGERQGVL